MVKSISFLAAFRRIAVMVHGPDLRKTTIATARIEFTTDGVLAMWTTMVISTLSPPTGLTELI